MFAQTIRCDFQNQGTEENRGLMAVLMPKWDCANEFRPMIASAINCLKAVFEPGVLSASSQDSTKTNTPLPQTFDQFLKQNAVQEKASESIQSLLVLAIALLGAMSLCVWWFLRR
jgi:hypothetical protein